MAIVTGISTGIIENPLEPQENNDDTNAFPGNQNESFDQDLINQYILNQSEIRVLQPKPGSIIIYDEPGDKLTFKLRVDTESVEQKYRGIEEDLMIGVAVKGAWNSNKSMILEHKNLPKEEKKYVNLTFRDVVSVEEIKDSIEFNKLLVLQPAVTTAEDPPQVLGIYKSTFYLDKQ